MNDEKLKSAPPFFVPIVNGGEQMTVRTQIAVAMLHAFVSCPVVDATNSVLVAGAIDLTDKLLSGLQANDAT